MRIGGKEFDLKKNTYIMGILNVTPDSFSDGGRYDGLDRAIEHAKQMIQEGVDIIDVGGESTRPGHVQITEEEEIARVVPVIRKLKKEFDIPVSIDTYKSAVAAAAIEAGADLVNDIWGLKYDSKMAGLIAKTGVACCLMHNRENLNPRMIVITVRPSWCIDLPRRNTDTPIRRNCKRRLLAAASLSTPIHCHRRCRSAVRRLIRRMLRTPVINLQNRL